MEEELEELRRVLMGLNATLEGLRKSIVSVVLILKDRVEFLAQMDDAEPL